MNADFDETAESRIPQGRRERNKVDKRERITIAARELFAERSVSEVTTAEIAQRADVAVGTLFLYAPTKRSLLLLAQNSAYLEASESGIRDSGRLSDPTEAVLALVRPIIHCNRLNVPNGRAYLNEVVFGDSESGDREHAIALMATTEAAVTSAIMRTTQTAEGRASRLATLIMSAMFLRLSSPLNAEHPTEKILADFELLISEVLQ